MDSPGVGVAVVGLGFGREFVPLYLRHPAVSTVAICDPDRGALDEYGERFGVETRYTGLDQVLSDDRIDAVHLVTPVGLHAEQAVAVLGSGRHCASAVPMALDLEGCWAVLDAARAARRTYMMMETAVYQREFLFTEGLLRRGELGGLTFLRGMHIRDRAQMPSYWRGFPPLKYATHAVSPLLALAGTHAETVHAFGSGHLDDQFRGEWHNPFALETAIVALAGTDVKAEVTQGCFHTARSEQEGFSAYGRRMSVEWAQREGDGLSVFTMAEVDPAGTRHRGVEHRRLDPPDVPGGLPAALVPFLADGPHSGSHPHLVHEFVDSIVAGRPARVDAVTAAEWTAVGICGHESALQEGAAVHVPDFRSAAGR